MELNKVYNGDCLEVLKGFPDNSIDSCVTDPTYGISFMNKHWDYQIPSVEVWKEVLRVLKPGGYILCACGTRTQHRMAVNIEDAGFEIRDVITWHYGSGFPKSLNISKAIEKKEGIEGETINQKSYPDMRGGNYGNAAEVRLSGGDYLPVSEDGLKWNGWGTALKPATEFWTMARKPLSENTVSENVLKYGTGGINIDGSRIETDDEIKPVEGGIKRRNKINQEQGFRPYENGFENQDKEMWEQNKNGRFPANVIFDEFTGKILDEQTGILTSGNVAPGGFVGEYTGNIYGKFKQNQIPDNSLYGDSGGASRFFYCPKADSGERNKGLKNFDKGEPPASARSKAAEGRENALGNPRANHHPTVKPIDLMRYLVKLVTVKGGTCIDPYCGSGTTLIGAKLELINYVGIDRESEYCKIAEARVASWNPDKYKAQTLF